MADPQTATTAAPPEPEKQQPVVPTTQQKADIMLADEDPLLISQSLTYVTDDGNFLAVGTWHRAYTWHRNSDGEWEFLGLINGYEVNASYGSETVGVYESELWVVDWKPPVVQFLWSNNSPARNVSITINGVEK